MTRLQGGLDARDDGRQTGRTPAQWYCLLAGAALLVAGLAGFIANASFDTGNGIQGDELVIFEVNAIHNLVHIASAALLLGAFARRGPAKAVALTFGLVYGLVTIIGIVDGEDVLGLIPVNPADNVLHILLSLAGIVAAFISPTAEGHRVDARADTRATQIARGDAARFDRGGEQAEAPTSGQNVRFVGTEDDR